MYSWELDMHSAKSLKKRVRADLLWVQALLEMDLAVKPIVLL